MLPLSRASGGQPAGPGGLLARVCASMPLPAAREAYPSPGRAFQPDRPPLQILLASRWQMGYLPLRAGCCVVPESQLQCAEAGTQRARDRDAGGSLRERICLTPWWTIRCLCSIAYRTGCPRRDRPGMARGAVEKADFQVESKKALPFAPAWDMDFRLCAGSGGMGPLTPHETNLRSYRC